MLGGSNSSAGGGGGGGLGGGGSDSSSLFPKYDVSLNVNIHFFSGIDENGALNLQSSTHVFAVLSHLSPSFSLCCIKS